MKSLHRWNRKMDNQSTIRSSTPSSLRFCSSKVEMPTTFYPLSSPYPLFLTFIIKYTLKWFLRSALTFLTFSFFLLFSCFWKINFLALVLRFDRLRRSLIISCRLLSRYLIFAFLSPCYDTSQFLEKFFDIMASLSRYLHITQAKLGYFRVGKRVFNSPFSIKVTLVTNNHDKSLLSSHFSHIVDPFAEVGKGIWIFVKSEVLVISNTIMAALESLI